jgi:hypothetical protein
MARYDAGLVREVAKARLPGALTWPLDDPFALTTAQVRALRTEVGNQLASLDFDVEDWSIGSPGTRLEDLIAALADYLPEMDGRFARKEKERPTLE